jgi:hypothetical protein
MDKVEGFKAELKSLMNKYSFRKYDKDNYNGEDEYCGIDSYFIVDGEPYYSQTINEIFDEILTDTVN